MHIDDIFEDLDVNDDNSQGRDISGDSGYDLSDEDLYWDEDEALEEDDDLGFENLDEDFGGRGQGRSSKKNSAERKSQGKKKKKGLFNRSPKELNRRESAIAPTPKENKAKKKKGRIKRIVIGALVEIVTLALICVYGYVLRTWSLVQNEEIDVANVQNQNLSLEKIEEMQSGYWTFAVFGVDSRSDNVVERGLNSDVIIIVNVNRSTGDIKLVSVFRDTYLNVSDDNLYQKINYAYSAGGPEQALAALNKNLDLNMTEYVAFNWKAVADGINILGGIDGITISRAELYYINAYITETVKVTGVASTQLTSTGEQHLDGVQAVAYGRLRKMDSDFARTERQRNVIEAAFSKAKNASFSVLNNIMVVCFPQVASNINLSTIVSMAQHITRYNIADTGGFPWSRGDAYMGSKGDCVIPTSLESNVIKLHEFLYDDTDYEPSSAVLRISDKIKSDSNLYNEGTVIDSVSTLNGVIQSTRASGSDGEGSDDSTADESDETESLPTIGINEWGGYVYETDENGEIIIPTDEDGEVIYPTDEYGNIIRPYIYTRPTELESETDEDGNPIDRGTLSTGSQAPHSSTSSEAPSGSGTDTGGNGSTGIVSGSNAAGGQGTGNGTNTGSGSGTSLSPSYTSPQTNGDSGTIISPGPVDSTRESGESEPSTQENNAAQISEIPQANGGSNDSSGSGTSNITVGSSTAP